MGELLKSGVVYHIYNHANGEDNLFREPDNYYFFLTKYEERVHPIAETFAYCLLPNHLHIMVRIREEKELVNFLERKYEDGDHPSLRNLGDLIKRLPSQQFSNLFNGYTKAYNKRFDRSGSLFRPNFNRQSVIHQKYFSNLLAYIHLNPVHHGIVTDLDEWPYSSWHAYVSAKPTKVGREEGLQWFEDLTAFRTFHREMKTQDVMLDFE